MNKIWIKEDLLEILQNEKVVYVEDLMKRYNITRTCLLKFFSKINRDPFYTDYIEIIYKRNGLNMPHIYGYRWLK